MQTGKTIVLIVKQSDTILSVKHKIHAAEGVLPDRNQLIYDRKVLANGRTLSDYNIQEGSTIRSAVVGKYILWML